MAPQDIQAFVFLAMIGVPCGLVVAIVFRRSRHPYLWTILSSAFIASFACIVIFGIWEATRSMTERGYPLGRAIHAGFGAAFLIAFAAPFASGGPAALIGLALQFILQRGWRRRHRKRPPPLPDVI